MLFHGHLPISNLVQGEVSIHSLSRKFVNVFFILCNVCYRTIHSVSTAFYIVEAFLSDRSPDEDEEDQRRKDAFFAPTLERDFETEIPIDDVPRDGDIEMSKKIAEIYITQEDMNDICSVHSELAKHFAYTEWTCCPAVSSHSMRASLANSFCDRYSVFAAVIDKYAFAFDQLADSILLPGMLVVANKALKMNAVPNQISDFYHTADVEQVSLFYPLLLRIRSHTETLLKQWEDHPTLKGVSPNCLLAVI